MKKLNVQWSEDRARQVPIRTKNVRILPLVKAILDPSLEEVLGLQELSVSDMTDAIETLSDEFILGLATEQLERGGRHGFVLNPRAFDFPQSSSRLAEVMNALLKRLGKAQRPLPRV